MKAYPYGEWIEPWLEKVEDGIGQALDGRSDMALAVSGHFRGARGKRIRPALALMAAGLTGGVSEDTIRLGTGIELVHMATLVHDDVIDDSDTRRGRPTPNGKWGNTWAVLTGDYLFAKAFSVLSGLDNAKVVSSLSRTVTTMCEGEWDQLRGRFDHTVDTDAYLRRISGKTASFMGCCCECGAHLAGAGKDDAAMLYDYGWNLGVAFQIMDDVLDYEGEAGTLGKPVVGDITTGVYTLPLILALRGGDSGCIIDELNKDMPDAAIISGMVRESGALGASRTMAAEYSLKATDSLSVFGDSVFSVGMKNLADFVCSRRF